MRTGPEETGDGASIGDRDLSATRIERPGAAGGPVPSMAASLDRCLGSNGGIDLLLVGLALDPSQSIRNWKNSQSIRDGHNDFVGRFGGQASPEVRIYVQDFNGRVYTRFLAPRKAVRLTGRNYRPSGLTRLYDGTVRMLERLDQAAREAEGDEGRSVRVIAAILTDGKDTRSSRTAADVRSVVETCRASGRWILLGLGVGGEVDFRAVFDEIGIGPEFVVVCTREAREIQRSFDTLGQLSTLSSRSEDDFMLTTLHGFETLSGQDPDDPSSG